MGSEVACIAGSGLPINLRLFFGGGEIVNWADGCSCGGLLGAFQGPRL